MRPSDHRDEGFTLIEVLAALMIFSVAIVGLIAANTQGVRTVTKIEQKMLAGVVADNALIEARRKELVIGERKGEAEARDIKFEWHQDITATEVENFFRIAVKVRQLDNEAFLVERVAYRSREP